MTITLLELLQQRLLLMEERITVLEEDKEKDILELLKISAIKQEKGRRIK